MFHPHPGTEASGKMRQTGERWSRLWVLVFDLFRFVSLVMSLRSTRFQMEPITAETPGPPTPQDRDSDRGASTLIAVPLKIEVADQEMRLATTQSPRRVSGRVAEHPRPRGATRLLEPAQSYCVYIFSGRLLPGSDRPRAASVHNCRWGPGAGPARAGARRAKTCRTFCPPHPRAPTRNFAGPGLGSDLV